MANCYLECLLTFCCVLRLIAHERGCELFLVLSSVAFTGVYEEDELN